MHLEVANAHIDLQAWTDAVRSDDMWLFAAQQWHALYGPWVPFDTGALYQVVEFEPGQINHLVSYAQKVYEGDYNYQKDVHPFATRYWDLAAAETQLPLLVAALQGYVDEGRLKVDGSVGS